MKSRPSYPVISLNEAETLIRTLTDELKEHEVIGIRGDNFAPIAKFRRSRYHGDDPTEPKQLPGVSIVEIGWDTASGPELDEKALRNALSIDKSSRNYDRMRPIDYGSRLFVILGKRNYSVEPTDFGEAIVSEHTIVAEIAIPNAN